MEPMSTVKQDLPILKAEKIQQHGGDADGEETSTDGYEWMDYTELVQHGAWLHAEL